MHSQANPMGIFERYLTPWVLLCIIGETRLGLFAREAAQAMGVLIEVPVMLWLVRMVNNSKGWYERTQPHA
ncbi:MAG TPA: hypothetical protein VN303_08275 [Pseudomonas sp.]|nr:hypothetical protein [Pseudomonas sp.]